MFRIEWYSQETLAELLSVVTLLVSWVLIQVAFARYYAHEFYGRNSDPGDPAFVFPNRPQPDYWDFIRFAFVIGMRIGTPRAQVTSRKMRRVVIAHCAVSFILNLSIFMLAVLIVTGGFSN